jgi:beta-N-acetylhexosaminidase
MRVRNERSSVWHSAASAAVLLPAFLAFAGCAGPTNEPEVPADPTRAVLERLTLEQKVGQLFVLFGYARDEGAERERLLDAIHEIAPGGVIVSLGTAAQAARFVGETQRAAAASGAGLPLLVAGDFERGLAFRLRDTTDFGPAMLLGATGRPELATAAGRATAVEGRALGCHWSFAPVVDINSNPSNPIIDVRAFGGEAELVARFGSAYVEGLQRGLGPDRGMIACLKHFPGHGDVDSDSHLVLSTVHGTRAELERRELLPFRDVLGGGAASVMVGHLAVPALDDRPGVPATMSEPILNGVLRERFEFDGLVVTDALDMGAVSGARPPAEVAIRALLAGADVLLMPPDPRAVRDAVVAAVEDGRVPVERLDEAVGRILRAKRRVGLIGPDGRVRADVGPRPEWRDALRTEEHLAIARQIAADGLVLVRDPEGRVPMRAGGGATVLVQVTDAWYPGERDPRGARLAERLGAWCESAGGGAFRSFAFHAAATAWEQAEVLAEIERAARVVLVLHTGVRGGVGRIGLPEFAERLAAAVAGHARGYVVGCCSPYVLPDFDEGRTAILCAFGSSTEIDDAIVDGLVGAAPVRGRLPVPVPGLRIGEARHRAGEPR